MVGKRSLILCLTVEVKAALRQCWCLAALPDTNPQDSRESSGKFYGFPSGGQKRHRTQGKKGKGTTLREGGSLAQEGRSTPTCALGGAW